MISERDVVTTNRAGEQLANRFGTTEKTGTNVSPNAQQTTNYNKTTNCLIRIGSVSRHKELHSPRPSASPFFSIITSSSSLHKNVATGLPSHEHDIR